MNRREWLVAIGGVTAFAGCSELTDDSDDQTLDPTSGNDTEASGDGDREQSETSESGAAGGSGSGGDPTDTVVAYFQAIDQGNLDRAGETIHPDSPEAQEELERLKQQNQEFFEQISITVQEATVITQEQDRAVVEVTATTELNGEEQTQTTQLELRPDDGTWKIWGDGSDEADETDSSSGNVDGDPAQVVVAFYDALNNARREELAELTHPDGPARTQLESLAEDDYQTWEEIEVGVDSTTVLEETDNRATVEAEVSFQSDTNVLQIELRPTAGRWRIWATQ